MHFDASMRGLWRDDGGTNVFDMPVGWSQGRAVFGGLVAAAAVSLATKIVDDDRALRLISVQMLRPAVPGPVEGDAQHLRSGKYATFVQVTLRQDGETLLTANMVFARPRPDSTPVAAAPMWHGADPESLQSLPYIPGVTPDFTQHISMRWATGTFPFMGAPEPRFRGYCRFEIPAGDVEGVVGLLDAWPAPSLSILTSPAPASTVGWTAHIIEVPESLAGWCRFEYETVVGEGAMHTIVGRLHSPDGRLVGWTEQLVAVYG